MLPSGVQLTMEASFPAEQENPGNCPRPPMMREKQEARVPLLDLVSAKQQLTPACLSALPIDVTRHQAALQYIKLSKRLHIINCNYET
ncbi:hypothetical protein J6590_100895, partial [Homalodisca vitripennis]